MIKPLISALLVCAGTQIALPVRADDVPPAHRDDAYRLDIVQRRIDRRPYDASLDVGVDRPVSVRVGAAVHASHIIVRLQQVHGTVRFHGDLSRLKRIAASHAGAVSAQE